MSTFGLDYEGILRYRLENTTIDNTAEEVDEALRAARLLILVGERRLASRTIALKVALFLEVPIMLLAYWM